MKTSKLTILVASWAAMLIVGAQINADDLGDWGGAFSPQDLIGGIAQEGKDLGGTISQGAKHTGGSISQAAKDLDSQLVPVAAAKREPEKVRATNGEVTAGNASKLTGGNGNGGRSGGSPGGISVVKPWEQFGHIVVRNDIHTEVAVLLYQPSHPQQVFHTWKLEPGRRHHNLDVNHESITIGGAWMIQVDFQNGHLTKTIPVHRVGRFQGGRWVVNVWAVARFQSIPISMSKSVRHRPQWNKRWVVGACLDGV